MMGGMQPKDRIQEGRGEVGFRSLLNDWAYAQVASAPAWGAFVLALAPLPGASNAIVGPAVVGPTTQHLHAQAVYAIDRMMLGRTLTRGLTTRKKNNGMIRNRRGAER